MVSLIRSALKVSNKPERPVIETERLVLRPHRPEDIAACAAMWADPLVTRYIGGKPFTREETWSRLLRYAGHWAWLGFGYWAVEDKATGEFMGEAGFADFQRELKTAAPKSPELGWVFASRVHGRGYATEAVQAALHWGDAHFSSAQIMCIVHPENQASIRVAEKTGFADAGITIYKTQPTRVFTRARL